MEDDGEIAPIDADRLDDHRNLAVDGFETLSPDDLAIQSIAKKLAASRPNDPEAKINQLAEDIYAKLCQLIASGKATDMQLSKASELFSEDVASIRLRLYETD